MKDILIETSARHIHVTEEQFHILFGKDAKLEIRAPLSQPGQFVSFSRLDIVGPKEQSLMLVFLDHSVKKGKLKFL